MNQNSIIRGILNKRGKTGSSFISPRVPSNSSINSLHSSNKDFQKLKVNKPPIQPLIHQSIPQEISQNQINLISCVTALIRIQKNGFQIFPQHIGKQKRLDLAVSTDQKTIIIYVKTLKKPHKYSSVRKISNIKELIFKKIDEGKISIVFNDGAIIMVSNAEEVIAEIFIKRLIQCLEQLKKQSKEAKQNLIAQQQTRNNNNNQSRAELFQQRVAETEKKEEEQQKKKQIGKSLIGRKINQKIPSLQIIAKRKRDMLGEQYDTRRDQELLRRKIANQNAFQQFKDKPFKPITSHIQSSLLNFISNKQESASQ